LSFLCKALSITPIGKFLKNGAIVLLAMLVVMSVMADQMPLRREISGIDGTIISIKNSGLK
jgi:hypothetical protein